MRIISDRRLLILVLVLCLPMILPILIHPKLMAPRDSGDWLQIYFHQAAVRQAILKYHEIPFWCPYINGGFPLAGHPYDPSLSPLLPITLGAGELLAPRINIMLIFFGGVTGMFLFCRGLWGLSRPATFCATLLYAFSGWLPARVVGGNYNESFYYLFPLILYCCWNTAANRRFFPPAVILLYLLLAEAKFAFPIVILYLLIIFLTAPFFFPGRSDKKIMSAKLLTTLGIIIVVTCLVGAPKIYLLLKLLKITDRVSYAQALGPPLYLGIGKALSFFYQEAIAVQYRTPHIDCAQISTSYLGCGIIPVLLGIFAMIKKPRQIAMAMLFLVLSCLLSMGRLLHLDLFSVLKILPIFNSIGNPLKYFNYFILFFIVILFGAGLDLLIDSLKVKHRPFFILMIAILTLFLPFWQNCRLIPAAFIQDIPRFKSSPRFFQVFTEGGYLYYNLKENVGLLDWYSSLIVPTRVIPQYVYSLREKTWLAHPGYRGEAYLLENGPVEVTALTFNTIKIKLESPRQDTLIINQNFMRGWNCNLGPVLNSNQLLAVSVPGPGKWEIELHYQDKMFFFILLVSALSVVILLLFSYWPNPAKRF